MIIYISKDDYEIKKFNNNYPIYKGDIFFENNEYKYQKRNYIILERSNEFKYPFVFSIGNKKVFKFFDVIDLDIEFLERINSK